MTHNDHTATESDGSENGRLNVILVMMVWMLSFALIVMGAAMNAPHVPNPDYLKWILGSALVNLLTVTWAMHRAMLYVSLKKKS